MAVSVLVWILAQPLNALIPNQRPGPGLLFNPFGWQMLFFAGVAMGPFATGSCRCCGAMRHC